jgi:hypothetical protein
MNRINRNFRHSGGFALVTTVSLMVLLAVMCVGLLGLSAVSLRSSSQSQSQAEAQANARLALMVAIGELQREMGPDMRVSAEAAIFDTNEDSEEIDGVAQPRWLASYDSWGNWLNAEYTKPEGGGSMQIQSTYTPQRENMFRRWLLSMPDGMRDNPQAALNAAGWNDSNSVVLVGEGTLGAGAEQSRPADITRAWLNPVGDTGRHAWWISPENHKARIDLASRSRELSPDAWETAQGNTAEVGVGILSGLDTLDEDPELAERLITLATLRPASVSQERAGELFYDLTAHSEGVLASVRSGHLKKDFSLLFENDNDDLPEPYRFNAQSDIVEPSIRPMSPEIASRAQLRNRHFQSWTNMRHFYRMYRSGTDATIGGTAQSNNSAGVLQSERGKRFTGVVCTSNIGKVGVGTGGADWNGSNNYWRVPILAKITFIYSLLAEPVPAQPGRFKCYHVFSPVFTYWNPYNTELRVPDGKITMASSAYRVWPHTGDFYLNGVRRNNQDDDWAAFGNFSYSQGINAMSVLRSGTGRDIVFKPGEFRVFSHRSSFNTGSQATSGGEAPLLPGFDPGAISGEKKDYGRFSPRGQADGTFGIADRPGLTVTFSHGLWGGNINRGNTGGSLCWQDWWDRPSNPNGMPITYANDWFNKAQTMTPMTPTGAGNIAYWAFDGSPLPIAFCQLVIKGISQFNYESISPGNPAPHNWARDWRSRNWIQAPPFYFGSGMYCSENPTIAHTQRLDNPYIVFFGPTSMGEMPKVVGQIGQNSFLGSGSNPFEQVTSVAALELPTAPISSLAGFAGMRINPGWTRSDMIGVDRDGKQVFFANTFGGSGWDSSGQESLHAAETKRVAYQSGVTGPGIGNSFIHPMLPRDDIYRFIDNSKSEDVPNRRTGAWMNTITRDSKAYCDYWDHVFLLNDALWDDYFVSSLADQTRSGASAAVGLSANIDRLLDGRELSNSRYRIHTGGRTAAEIKSDLQARDGYLKAARHLVVDGMFNVNSTSVSAWYSLFAGIRERQLVYRNSSGSPQTIDVPSGKRIAIARFNTEVSNREMDDPATGVNMPDGSPGWSGVRFLDDRQLLKLAEECVKQVKQRGPFLNFAEFINRRLSNDQLGLMGALQSAIDYDDASPESGSINHPFKNGPDFMMKSDAMGRTSFSTPQAAEGSRFAGIPGYVIQSDLLKPIANTLSVRDDTFRIRAYGEAREPGANGKVLARAWCEAIVQRVPEYSDPSNDPSEPARLMDKDGVFSDNSALTSANRRFGRKFVIRGFRWLAADEV